MLAKKSPFTFSPLDSFEEMLERLSSPIFDTKTSKRLLALPHMQEDGTLTYSMDLPGVKQSDLSVEVVDRVVSVKAERKTTVSSYSVVESFSVPDNFDTSKLSAELSDGVLVISLPPLEQKTTQTRKIEVKTK